MQSQTKWQTKWYLLAAAILLGGWGIVLLTANGQSQPDSRASDNSDNPSSDPSGGETTSETKSEAPVASNPAPGGSEKAPDSATETSLKPVKAPLSAPEIADYQKWHVVNPQTYRMAQEVAMMCATPSHAPVEKISLKSSHRSSHPRTKDKFIRVFVNEKGRHAMFQLLKPRFAEGSVIVKEKLASRDSQKPELLTVMIKQRAGYDPKKGDWEYLVTDGAGKKVYERGQLPSCQNCHVTQSENDYVFRPYVTVPTVSGRTEVKPSNNSSRE